MSFDTIIASGLRVSAMPHGGALIRWLKKAMQWPLDFWLLLSALPLRYDLVPIVVGSIDPKLEEILPCQRWGLVTWLTKRKLRWLGWTTLSRFNYITEKVMANT